ncbi:hypothetical protein ACVXG9_08615 [Escherichia coli]
MLQRLPQREVAVTTSTGESALILISCSNQQGSVTDDFAPDGQLAKAIPGFKPREPQRQMAVAVTAAIEKGQPLVVEAGTGTGKTYAYLALRCGRRSHYLDRLKSVAVY